jgi:hypothetical protein
VSSTQQCPHLRRQQYAIRDWNSWRTRLSINWQEGKTKDKYMRLILPQKHCTVIWRAIHSHPRLTMTDLRNCSPCLIARKVRVKLRLLITTSTPPPLPLLSWHALRPRIDSYLNHQAQNKGGRLKCTFQAESGTGEIHQEKENKQVQKLAVGQLLVIRHTQSLNGLLRRVLVGGHVPGLATLGNSPTVPVRLPIGIGEI